MDGPPAEGSPGGDLRESLLYVLADAETFDEALERTLAAICRAGEWEYGEAWLPASDGDAAPGADDSLVLAATWAEPGYEAFAAATADVSFARGEGLVGRVWDGNDAEWLTDLSDETVDFVRAESARAVGLLSGVAIPLPESDDAVVPDPIAVLGFFTATPRAADPAFASAAAEIVAGTGRLFARKRAADALAEEHRLLEAVLDATPAPVVVYDATGAVESVNEAGVAAIGLDAAGMRDCDRFDERWALETAEGDPLGDGDRPVSRAFQSGEPAQRRLRATLPSGERRTFDLHASPVVGDDGVVEHVVAVFRDVTESVAYERDLEARNDALGEFASVVSHDLRNPLAVVDGYIDLAIETGDTTHLAPARAAIDRMDDLIRGLLALARSGATVGDRRSIELADAATAAWESVETDEATLVVHDGLPSVAADPVRLGQLIENLLGNAVTHAGETATVHVRPLSDGGGFAVDDDGPGIEADRREVVFAPGHSSGGDGAGLGLTLVRTVAEAHGWRVRADESAEGGARFEIHTGSPDTN